MSKDKAFGEGSAVFAIEEENVKVENKKEEMQTEKSEKLENKIQELKERGTERVAEVEERLNKLIEQTGGWDAEGQPEYKRKMRETIADYLQKQISRVKKLEGRTLISDYQYEEALGVFDLLEKYIGKINILEEDKNSMNEARMTAMANAPLTSKGELSFTGQSGYSPYSWENMAKREMEKNKI